MSGKDVRSGGSPGDRGGHPGTDLIVIATHGLGGLTHVMLGSVTDKVLRRAGCPVLTVKAFGKVAARHERRRWRKRDQAADVRPVSKGPRNSGRPLREHASARASTIRSRSS